MSEHFKRDHVNHDQFTDLMFHNDVWVPENVRAGSIIGCQLMTHANGEYRPFSRSAMILGFQVDPEDFSYTGLHVLPLRFGINDNDEHAFSLGRYHEKEGNVSGVKLPAQMPYGEIHYVPMDIKNFTYWNMALRGHVSEDLFTEVCEEIRNYQSSGHKIKHIGAPKIQGTDYTLLAPHQSHLSVADVIPHHPIHSLDKETEELYKLADVHRRMNTLSGNRVAEFISDLHLSAQQTARHERYINRMTEKAQKDRRFYISHKRETCFSTEEQRSDLSQRIDKQLAKMERDPTHREKYEYVLALLDGIKNGPEALSALQQEFEQRKSGRSYIELPSFLWQGRYISMKINSLMDESVSGNAFRPCIVWKLYEDRNTGELAGMELHPCTRNSADNFKYKMPANPLYTRSLNPGFLVADCLVRVPFHPRYFQDSAHTRFNELPGDKFMKFRTRRDHVMSNGNDLRIWGLKERPENWVERPLEERPSDQWLEKQFEARLIGLDGHHIDRFREKQAQHKLKKQGNVPA
ncbi:MAG: hypothetical protein H6868_05740 [Rhodospirillales bacterium]|nr:hypothetical protein [Rhodospirillales bacterium]